MKRKTLTEELIEYVTKVDHQAKRIAELEEKLSNWSHAVEYRERIKELERQNALYKNCVDFYASEWNQINPKRAREAQRMIDGE